MSNETGLGSTGISGSVPAWLRTKALKARYAASQVWKNGLNAIEGDPLISGNINKMGDRVTFQIMPVLTIGDISTADGSLANQVISPTQSTITINKWKGINAAIVDIVDAQSVVNWDEKLAEGYGEALSEQQDVDVAALASSLTTNTAIGDNASAFTDPNILLAQRRLDDVPIPKEDRYWVIAPSAHADILSVDKFTLANTTGFNRGIQVEGGRIVGLYGTPVNVTKVVATSGGARLNFLAHREALGIAMQKNFRMEKWARTQWNQGYGGSCLYGVGVVRNNHGIQYLTQA